MTAEIVFCSFCGCGSNDESVTAIVRTREGTAICDHCIAIAWEKVRRKLDVEYERLREFAP